MGTAELDDDRECTHKEGYRDILHNLRTIRHHQDEERRYEEHERELKDNKRSHLTEFLGSRHTTDSYLIGQCRCGQTNGTEAYSHRISHQTDDSRKHRLETKSDQDGSRNSHSRSEAGHTLKHTSQTPCQQQHKQALIRGHLDKLRLDSLNFLRLTKNIVAEDCTDNNKDDGETCLQESLDDRPERDAVDRSLGILLRHNAHRRDGKQGQKDCYCKSDYRTLVTRYFKAHHQNDEQ